LIGHQFIIVYHSLFDFDDPGWTEDKKLFIKYILNLNPYFFFRINKEDLKNRLYFSIAIAIQAVTGTIMMFILKKLLQREMTG
jgi:DNA helicase HerA-like ATPase